MFFFQSLGDSDDGDYNAVIAKAKQAKAPGTEFPYSFRDVILYSTHLPPSPFPTLLPPN